MKRTYLPSLFDTIDLDRPLAIEHGYQGKEQAADHAEQESAGWNQKAYDHLLSFIGSISGQFMGEDIRKYAERKGHPKPPSNRAWGQIISRASREGLIRKVGIRPVSNVKAHGANAAVWIKS